MPIEAKNPPANAGDVQDMGSISGLEDPLEEGVATHSSILGWRISWIEELGGLQSMGLQKLRFYSVTRHTAQHTSSPAK